MKIIPKFAHGNLAAYKYIDFNETADSLIIHLLPGKTAGKLIFCIDKPWHERIAVVNIPGNENPDWITDTFPVKDINGVHALWLILWEKKICSHWIGSGLNDFCVSNNCKNFLYRINC